MVLTVCGCSCLGLSTTLCCLSATPALQPSCTASVAARYASCLLAQSMWRLSWVQLLAICQCSSLCLRNALSTDWLERMCVYSMCGVLSVALRVLGWWCSAECVLVFTRAKLADCVSSIWLLLCPQQLSSVLLSVVRCLIAPLWLVRSMGGFLLAAFAVSTLRWRAD